MTDPIIAAARFLTAHLEWLRHRSATEIQECFADIAAAARVVAGIARGPSEQKYLGPCGAEKCAQNGIGDHDCIEHGTCDGDVYGRAGAATGACRTCGATVDQAERRAWLDEEAGSRSYRASELEDALRDHPDEACRIKAHTIRMWADRGRIRIHDHDLRGRPRYLYSEVLERAREVALARAEKATRRRRTPAA